MSLIKVLAFILYFIIKLLIKTYRLTYLAPAKKGALKSKAKSPYIYALWHQNLIAGLASEMKNPHCMVISRSKDGELLATTCQLLGHKPVRGSSHRGGTAALKGIVRLVQSGIPGCLTVDGPKGPPHEIKKGILELSLLTGAPIIPLLPIASRFWSFEKSWDSFRLPKPFSKIYIWHGEPIKVTQSDKKDNYNQISQSITKQLKEAEQKIFNELIKPKTHSK